ncbi:transposase family protein [Streptomyces kronopolitis]|uniref:transposase family protein n=1 Tax=Streptomyces kronopolitis TaxID=1612435 RepID=UPI0036A10910
MLSYPATIPLSSRTLNHLADRIRGHRQQRRSRWRGLEPGRQALLALAHLRNGDTYTRLAAGFQIGVVTAWRYVQEAISLLSAAADGLDTAMRRRVMTFADKGYQGARGSVRTPFKRRRFRPKLSRRQKAVNRAHAKIRARGERAIATLKTRRILVKLRGCPRRATAIVQAILVLHHVESPRYEG